MAYNHEYPYIDPATYNDDWLLNKMHELIEEWQQVQGDWKTQQEAFESLKAFITNYFDNLDVQNEINNKLDEMVKDGTIQALLNNIVGTQSIPLFASSTAEMINIERPYVLYPDNYIYVWNGTSWINTGIQYGGAGGVYIYPSVITPDNFEQYGLDKIDNQRNNSIATYNSAYASNVTRGIFPEPSQISTCFCFVGSNALSNSQVQICMTATNNIYARFKISSGWFPWVNLNGISSINMIGNVVTNANTQGIENIDSQPINSIATYAMDYVSNPDRGTFPPTSPNPYTVLCFVGANIPNSIVQLATCPEGSYIRMKLSSGYTEWLGITHLYEYVENRDSYITESNYEKYGINSVDEQPHNTIITYTSTYTNVDSHGIFPVKGDIYTVFTLSGYGTPKNPAQNTISQLAFTPTSLYFRMKLSTGWAQWKNVFGDNNVIEGLYNNYVYTCVDKPINISEDTKIYVFGDSISTKGTDGKAWCDYLTDKFGCVVENYAVSGSRFTDTGSQIITQVQNAVDLETANLIFVEAGVNEFALTDYSLLRTAVEEVINEIKTINSTAPIVFITPMRCTRVNIINTLPNISGTIINTAIINHCSVINGFDFPIAMDTTSTLVDMSQGDQLHPNNNAKWAYCVAVLNALL